MTNREKIAEMKVVDFFEKYVHDEDISTFTTFVVNNIRCNKCPQNCGNTLGICYDRLDEWLDKEVEE